MDSKLRRTLTNAAPTFVVVFTTGSAVADALQPLITRHGTSPAAIRGPTKLQVRLGTLSSDPERAQG